MAPPLPIPNREVKRNSAHDTSTAGKIGHRQGFFVCKVYPTKPPVRAVFWCLRCIGIKKDIFLDAFSNTYLWLYLIGDLDVHAFVEGVV